MSLTYRELTPEEYPMAPREVVGSEIYTPTNSRILAGFNEKGEIVTTWTMFPMVHIEPLWIREDYRNSPTILRRMAQHMKSMMRESGILSCYTVVMSATPVLRRFAEWFGAKAVDGTLYYWVDPRSETCQQ
jgi:hypothetical protein